MMFLAGVLSRVARTRLTDVTSGFRAANRRAIDQYVRYYPAEYLGDTVDSLVSAIHSGLTVTQMPVAMRRACTGGRARIRSVRRCTSCRSVFALSLALLRGRRRPDEVSA